MITEAEDLAKIDACTNCRYGAPVVLLVCYDRDDVWVRPFDNANSGEVDASIVTTYMTLEAQDLGLGTCWVMYFDPSKAIELFALPENIIPVAMLPMGYPLEESRPSKKHFDRKPLEDLLLP